MRCVNEADIIVETPSGQSVGLTHYLICVLTSVLSLHCYKNLMRGVCIDSHHSSQPTHRLNPGYGVSRDDNHQNASKMG